MRLKNFKLSEFDCRETKENKMDKDFLTKLDSLRSLCGFPFVVTSGYRSVSHSLEVNKHKPGKHTKGIAADIKINKSVERFFITKYAIELGFKGIGIGEDFVHVDTRKGRAVIWTYY